MPKLKDGHYVDPYDNEVWVQDGAYHREDGPAVKSANGTNFWYRKGEQHREDGPALIQMNTTRVWYRNGKKHRLDGPAVIWSTGDIQYWIEGVEVSGIPEVLYNIEIQKNKRVRIERWKNKHRKVDAT